MGALVDVSLIAIWIGIALSSEWLRRAVATVVIRGNDLPRVEPVTVLPSFVLPRIFADGSVSDTELRHEATFALLFVGSAHLERPSGVKEIRQTAWGLLHRMPGRVLVVCGGSADAWRVQDGMRKLASADERIAVVSDDGGSLMSTMRIERTPTAYMYGEHGRLVHRGVMILRQPDSAESNSGPLLA